MSGWNMHDTVGTCTTHDILSESKWTNGLAKRKQNIPPANQKYKNEAMVTESNKADHIQEAIQLPGWVLNQPLVVVLRSM